MRSLAGTFPEQKVTSPAAQDLVDLADPAKWILFAHFTFRILLS